MKTQMVKVYEMVHRRTVEIEKNTGENICDTKLLGFFSDYKKCQDAIAYYITQPGFKEYPEDFIIEEIEADIDDYCKVSGSFEKYVYYLSHEWYDGQYDYIRDLGYYSTNAKAKYAESLYRLESDLIEHQEGFCVDEYEIDKMEWTEGFFICE